MLTNIKQITFVSTFLGCFLDWSQRFLVTLNTIKCS